MITCSSWKYSFQGIFWGFGFFSGFKETTREDTGKNINIPFSTIENCLHKTNADRQMGQRPHNGANKPQTENKQTTNTMESMWLNSMAKSPD